MRGGIAPLLQKEERMELKLEKRELKLDVYGKVENLIFPSVKQQQAYLKELLADDANEVEATSKYFVELGMSNDSIDVLELAHMYEVLEVISGQKKI
jgi:hypothetical protein